jgi:hypothetical protein
MAVKTNKLLSAQQKKLQKSSKENFWQRNQKLITLLGCILVGVYFATLAYAHYWLPRLHRMSIEQTKPLMTTQPRQTISIEEKTYVNNKFGYSFNYPEETWIASGEPVLPTPVLTDELVMLRGLDSLVVQIEPIATIDTDPQVWWRKQTFEHFHDKPASCFSTQLVTEVKSHYEPSETVTTLESPALALNLKLTPDCADPSDHILIVSHRGKLLKLIYDDAIASEEILSSLKWF